MPTLTLPGELSSLEAIADLVVDQARVARLDKRASYQLQLAVDELATNIIVHGYQEAGLTGNITLSVDVTDESLVVVLEDSAVPYDPRRHDVDRVAAGFQTPLHEREIGGLGVYFVMQAVDEFRYEWLAGKNRNTLVVHRQPADSNPQPAAAGTHR